MKEVTIKAHKRRNRSGNVVTVNSYTRKAGTKGKNLSSVAKSSGAGNEFEEVYQKLKPQGYVQLADGRRISDVEYTKMIKNPRELDKLRAADDKRKEDEKRRASDEKKKTEDRSKTSLGRFEQRLKNFAEKYGVKWKD